MHVPTPPHGYWNKKAAGKPAMRLALPPRPVGQDDTVVLAGGRYGRYYQHSISQKEILGPVSPAPTFAETMNDVPERLDAMLPKVPSRGILGFQALLPDHGAHVRGGCV